MDADRAGTVFCLVLLAAAIGALAALLWLPVIAMALVKGGWIR